MFNKSCFSVFCISLLSLIALSLSSTTFAQIPEYPAILWKVEGNNLEKPSYLFGTMHSRDKRIHDALEHLMPMIQSTEAVALELISSPMDMIKTISYMRMKDTLLTDLISDEEYQIVEKKAKAELGLLAAMLNINKIKPIFLSTLFTQMKMGQEMSEPLDMRIQKIGKENNKALIGIETVEEQMAALNSVSLKEQAQMLMDGLELGEEQDSLMELMTQYYLNEDLDSLLFFYQSQQDEMYSDQFDAALIVKRNKVMAARIDSIFQLKSTFAAVGALHLPGEIGLINLLKLAGYKLSPINIRKEIEKD